MERKDQGKCYGLLSRSNNELMDTRITEVGV